MATAAEIMAKIGVDLSQFKQGMQEARDDTEKQKGFFKSAFGDMVGVAGGMLAAAGLQFGIGQIVGTMKDWITSAIEAKQNQEALNAVLKSTHDAVGMSADQINTMVQNLKNLTGVDDDVLLQGTNMLLTFTNIGSTVFPQANQAMLDMAVAMNHGSLQGLDLKDTAIQLGKALNDPIQGLTALSRVGVTFTDQQKEQIKAMIAAGDTAGAQKLILGELEREFGGAAAAAGNADPFNKFSLAVGDIGKTVGALVLPALTALMNNVLTPMANWLLNNLTPAGKALGDAFSQIGKAAQEILFPLKPLWDDLSGLFQQAIKPLGDFLHQTFGPAIKDLKAPLDDISSPVLALNNFVSNLSTTLQLMLAGVEHGAGPFGSLRGQLQGFLKDLAPLGDLAKNLWGDLQNLFHILVDQGGQSFQQMRTDWLPIVQQLATWFQQQMLPAIMTLVPPVERLANIILTKGVPAFFQIREQVSNAAAAIAKTLLPIFETIEPIVVRFAGFLLDLGGKALAFLIPKVEEAFKAISQFATEMSTRLSPFIQRVASDIQQAADIIQTVWGILWPWMSALLKTAWDIIQGVVKTLWDFLTGIFKIGADILSGNWGQLWADVKSLFSNLTDDLRNIGTTFWSDLQGIFQAGGTIISNAWSTVWNGLAGIASSAWDGVKGAIATGINAAIDLINDMITMADKVPGVTIPQLQHVSFAFGGQMPYSGFARVGDAGGAEYAFFPKGTQVVSHQDAMRALSGATGGSGETHIHNYNGITTPQDLRRTLTIEAQRKAALYGR